MQFKTLYNRLAHRDEPFKFEKPSLTIQEPKEDCDINHIVELYCGINPQYNPLLQEPFFDSVDTASLPADLLEAYSTVEDINARFASLPSRLREEVGNSPVNMLQWISNPNNYKRGVELGIFNQASGNSQPANGSGMVNAEHISVNNPLPADNNTVTA